MILPFDFVSGLVEGEGCFSLNFRSDLKKHRPRSPQYFRWHALFAIVLRSDDYALLDKVKENVWMWYSKLFKWLCTLSSARHRRVANQSCPFLCIS